MPFLELKDGVVSPTPEGEMLSVVKSLSDSDKTKTKTYFHDALLYVFYVYKKDGVYADSFETYRKKIVITRHLPNRTIDDFENNKRVQALIAEYNERQYTKLERFYYQIEKDMESLLTQISTIPYQKSVKAQLPYKDDEGNETKIAGVITIDNYEEKAKAIMMAEKLIDYADKLKTKIIKEKAQSGRHNNVRLFDKATLR